MKKKISSLLINLLLLLFLVLTIKNKIIIKNATITSFILWYQYLIPAIFPTLIITNLMITLNVYLIIPDYLNNKFNHIFNCNGYCLILIIIGFIIGSPTSAYLYTKAYDNKMIDIQTYQKLIKTSLLINPFFFISITNYLTFKKQITILFINYLIAMILLKIIKIPNHQLNINSINNHPINLIKIINDSFKILINILSIIIFFNILLSILNQYCPNNIICLLLSNIEITNGYNYIKMVNNDHIQIIATSFLTSFLGLAILFQIKSIIDNNTLFKKLFVMIIIRSLISTLTVGMLT